MLTSSSDSILLVGIKPDLGDEFHSLILCGTNHPRTIYKDCSHKMIKSPKPTPFDFATPRMITDTARDVGSFTIHGWMILSLKKKHVKNRVSSHYSNLENTLEKILTKKYIRLYLHPDLRCLKGKSMLCMFVKDYALHSFLYNQWLKSIFFLYSFNFRYSTMNFFCDTRSE